MYFSIKKNTKYKKRQVIYRYKIIDTLTYK